MNCSIIFNKYEVISKIYDLHQCMRHPVGRHEWSGGQYFLALLALVEDKQVQANESGLDEKGPAFLVGVGS